MQMKPPLPSSLAMAMAVVSSLLLLFFFSTTAAASAAAVAQGEPPQLHHDLLLSSRYFLSNYHLMLSSFKIFIYPVLESHADSDFRSLQFGYGYGDDEKLPQTAEELFFLSLSRSDFVTEDAEEADLFFLPVSLGAMLRKPSVNIGRNLKTFVQELRNRFPYWQRTLGADHFVASCHGFKSEVHRNVLELRKNSIWLVCAHLFGGSEGGDSEFFPHKDLAMPPYRPQPMDIPPSSANLDWQERPHLVYVLERPLSSDLELWKEESDFVFASQDSHFDMLASSKFCLTFASSGHNSSIVDGMRLGCVPVIVSSGYLHGLPFQDILDWQRFSVVVSFKELAKLKSFLTAMPEAKYRALQQAAKAASSHLQWHTPPRSYDAFHMLMYELWLRRHTIRYAGRNIQ